jgi:hypothetical protein
MEEKVFQRQVTKTDLSLTILDEKELSHAFTKKELRELFSFPDTDTCTTHELMETPKVLVLTQEGTQYLIAPFTELTEVDPLLAGVVYESSVQISCILLK